MSSVAMRGLAAAHGATNQSCCSQFGLAAADHPGPAAATNPTLGSQLRAQAPENTPGAAEGVFA